MRCADPERATRAAARDPDRRDHAVLPESEKDAELAQKLGQRQPFISAFPQECVGQLAFFWAMNLTPSPLKPKHHTGGHGPCGGDVPKSMGAFFNFSMAAFLVVASPHSYWGFQDAEGGGGGWFDDGPGRRWGG